MKNKQFVGLHNIVVLLALPSNRTDKMAPKDVRDKVRLFKSGTTKWYKPPAPKGIDRVLRVLVKEGLVKHHRSQGMYSLTPKGASLAGQLAAF
jgi:DNA-binding PadR family transcriptional regulator